MASFYIQRPQSIDKSKVAYYVKKHHWSDDYGERKTWATSTTPTNLMKNPDGKNGGWEGATVVEEE